MSSSMFSIILPSNTKNIASTSDDSEGEQNRPYKFRIHFPKKLMFDKGLWLCGLKSIVYPNTWPAIGTSEAQYIEVMLRTNQSYQFQIPKGSYLSPRQLEAVLEKSILKQIDEEFAKKKLTSLLPVTRVKRNSTVKNDSVEKKQKIVFESIETDPIREENPRVPERIDDIVMGTIVPREYGKIKAVEEGDKKVEDNTKTLTDSKTEFKSTATKSDKQTDSTEKSVPIVILEDDSDDDLISDDEEDFMAHKLSRGDVFKEYPDLLKRFNKNPKSLKNIIQLFKEKEERDKEQQQNDTLKESIQGRKRWLMKVASSVAGVGTPEYWKLMEHIDDEEKFAETLKALPQIKVEEYNKKLYEEYETRLLLAKAVKFEYQEDIARFALKINDPRIKYVQLSEQISYVLGFEVGAILRDGEIAKYACDLRGGVSHLCVYINNGVIENTIIGDTMASLLQVVAVSGKPGDIMEKTYETPNFCKLITKELSEVTIEIRSLEGRPIPFIGVVIVTLVFKRLTIF